MTIDFPGLLGPDGRPLVRQRLSHPAVYLDTWALRLFAEDDPQLGKRFRTALERCKGTLVLSHLTLAEFARFNDPRHADAAGGYLDTLYPHLFFSKFDPFDVMRNEIEIMVGRTRETPAGDAAVLAQFAEDSHRAGSPALRQWFLAVYSQRARLEERLRGVGTAFLDGFQQLRERFNSEPRFAKSALRDIRTSTRPRATQALLRALLYRLRQDPKLQLSLNDSIDILHALVASAYGDFVLIDSTWQRRLADAIAFMRRAGITTRVAACYARRDDGVMRFLNELEAWPAAALVTTGESAT